MQAFVAITWCRPEGAVKVLKNLEGLISRINATNVECYMMGDTNSDFISPNNGTKHLKVLFDTYSLTQTTDEPTRTTQDTKTLIDHIPTNRPNLASDCGVIPRSISNHDVVYMVRKTKFPKVKLQPKVRQQEILKILTKFNLGWRWIIFWLILLGMYLPV